jgi:hypothetical protein
MSEHHDNPLAENPPPSDFTFPVPGMPVQAITLRPIWDPAANAFRFQPCLMVADTLALRFATQGSQILFAAIPFDAEGKVTVERIREELAKMREEDPPKPLLVPA